MASLTSKQTMAMPPASPEKCSSGCCRTNTSLWYKVLKLFLVIAVLVFVFCAGAASVVRVGYGGMSKNLMYSRGMMIDWDDDRAMMKGLSKIDVIKWQRVFGTITKIESNKITITDNAAMEDVIVSKQDTIIAVNGIEAGLAALKVGQNVVVVYSLNDAQQMEAKTISVQ